MSGAALQQHVDIAMSAIMTLPISSKKYKAHCAKNPRWTPNKPRPLYEDGLRAALEYMREELLSVAADFPDFEIQFRTKAMACFEMETFVTHLCNAVQHTKGPSQRVFDEIPRERFAYNAAKLDFMGKLPSSTHRGAFGLCINEYTNRVEILYEDMTVVDLAKHMLRCAPVLVSLKRMYPQLEEALTNLSTWSAWVVPDRLGRVDV